MGSRQLCFSFLLPSKLLVQVLSSNSLFPAFIEGRTTFMKKTLCIPYEMCNIGLLQRGKSTVLRSCYHHQVLQHTQVSTSFSFYQLGFDAILRGEYHRATNNGSRESISLFWFKSILYRRLWQGIHFNLS